MFNILQIQKFRKSAPFITSLEKTCAGHPLRQVQYLALARRRPSWPAPRAVPGAGKPGRIAEGSSRGDIAGSFARARAARACGRAPGMGQTFREVSKLTPAALWSSTELSMVGVETSTGVGHPKKLVQRASRGLGKTFFTRKKPVKYAMDGLLVRLGPLQTFCRWF